MQAIPAPAVRRIQREARSATLRERALALHEAGWRLSEIGRALGVSVPRVHQLIRKAKRLAAETGILPKDARLIPTRQRRLPPYG